VHYSPLLLTWDEVVSQLQHVLQDSSAKVMNSARVVEIPVCYGAQFANDLAHVAAAHGMTTDDVIRLHSGAEYTVRMIGFSPGFPYLAGLPNELITPRLKTPRLKVPSGSVAIGGRQTGIYSLETPGGWNIIGRTPVEMFRPDQHPPCFLNAGDQVRFVAISAEEFHERQEHGS
jgi:inhibitor of KinA